VDVKNFVPENSKSKINAKYKLSDGSAFIHAMLLQ
jgi:hypothetical protein